MISAVVLTKNEEENIKDCLTSLSFCIEIIVVDDNSSDATSRIAERLGAKVFIRDSRQDFASQRNFGLEKTTHNWVLFLDADERITPLLAAEIKAAIKYGDKNMNGYLFKRHDFIWRKLLKNGEVGSIRLLRLAKKSAGVWKRKVHEYWDIEAKLSEFKNPIIHYPHQTVNEFIASVNKWSAVHALTNRKEWKKSNLLKIILLPKLHFFRNFFLRQGFCDGVYGFVFAVIMSFHSFLSWSNLWLMQKKLFKR